MLKKEAGGSVTSRDGKARPTEQAKVPWSNPELYGPRPVIDDFSGAVPTTGKDGTPRDPDEDLKAFPPATDLDSRSVAGGKAGTRHDVSEEL